MYIYIRSVYTICQHYTCIADRSLFTSIVTDKIISCKWYIKEYACYTHKVYYWNIIPSNEGGKPECTGLYFSKIDCLHIL